MEFSSYVPGATDRKVYGNLHVSTTSIREQIIINKLGDGGMRTSPYHNAIYLLLSTVAYRLVTRREDRTNFNMFCN